MEAAGRGPAFAGWACLHTVFMTVAQRLQTGQVYFSCNAERGRLCGCGHRPSEVKSVMVSGRPRMSGTAAAMAAAVIGGSGSVIGTATAALGEPADG